MNWCDDTDIIKLDSDFDDDFDTLFIDIISRYKRIYFLDQKGFGIKAKPSNSKFDKSVDLLPQNLTHIKFGYAFNQPVDNLPFRLQWLEFGYMFNQRVDMLPNTITYLVFGYSFNQPVYDLPNSLEHVSFGKKFNYPLNSLPNSIFYISIGSVEIDYYNGTYHFTEFNQPTYNLPTKLNNIMFCKQNKKYPIKSNFKENLNKLIEN